MYTITMFGLSHGIGRTTLTMALAAASVAKGRRVLLVDACRGASSGNEPGLLACWTGRQHAEGVPTDALVASAPESGDLEDILDHAEWSGIHTALIDTGARVTPHHAISTLRSDLVLVPFGREEDAKIVGQHIADAEARTPLFGVHVHSGGPELRRQAVIKAFGGPVLKTGLPFCKCLRDMPGSGRLDRHALAHELSASGPRTGFSNAFAMRLCWTEVLTLATEVEWLLQGYTLEPAVRSRPGEPTDRERPFRF